MQESGANKDDATQILKEINEILQNKERGLKILKELGRKPEQSVLENKAALEEAKALLLKLL